MATLQLFLFFIQSPEKIIFLNLQFFLSFSRIETMFLKLHVKIEKKCEVAIINFDFDTMLPNVESKYLLKNESMVS